MSEKPRTAEEVEAEIQRTRLAMQSTVDELTNRLDPRSQAKNVADKAAASASKIGEETKNTFKRAKEGDVTSISRLASAATVVGVVVGLIALKKR